MTCTGRRASVLAPVVFCGVSLAGAAHPWSPAARNITCPEPLRRCWSFVESGCTSRGTVHLGATHSPDDAKVALPVREGGAPCCWHKWQGALSLLFSLLLIFGALDYAQRLAVLFAPSRCARPENKRTVARACPVRCATWPRYVTRAWLTTPIRAAGHTLATISFDGEQRRVACSHSDFKTARQIGIEVEELIKKAEELAVQLKPGNAAAHFRAAVETAESCTNAVGIDARAKLVGEAKVRLGGFLLASGHACSARDVLFSSIAMLGGTGALLERGRLLYISALRESGEAPKAAAAAQEFLHKFGPSEATLATPTSRATEAAIAEAQGELACSWLVEGRAAVARELLVEAVSRMANSDHRLLFAKLTCWLGLAELADGRSWKALHSADAALAVLNSQNPAGVAVLDWLTTTAGITQESLQLRARARIGTGQLMSAREDVDQVMRSQEELWGQIVAESDSARAIDGGDQHPEPRLRGSMARSWLILAELTLAERSREGEVATSAAHQAQEALTLLQEIGGAAVPVAPGMATVAEARAVLRRAEAATTALAGAPAVFAEEKPCPWEEASSLYSGGRVPLPPAAPPPPLPAGLPLPEVSSQPFVRACLPPPRP